jgi:sugar phosphate permease
VTSPLPARPTRVRYFVLAAICAITVVNYIQRNSIGSLVTSITGDLHIDKEDIGFATALFFVTYALLQIPTGKLAQRFGPRRVLTLLALGWSLATAGMAAAQEAWGFIALRGLQGALQAGIFPCATLIMVAWLPSFRRGLASALLNSCMLIGSGVVFNFTGLLRQPLGWRMLLVVYALPGLLWAVWFWWWFRDRPDEKHSVNDAERDLIVAGQAPATTGVPALSLAVLLSLPLWLICAQQMMRAGASRFVDQWLSTYLQEGPLSEIADTNARQDRANHLTSFPQYIGIISGPIGGFASDWILRRTGRRRAARNGVAVVALGLAILCYVPILFVSGAGLQVLFFTVGMFVSTCAAPCAYAVTMDVGGKNLPVVFGAMNMVGNFGAAAITGLVSPLNRWTGGSWNASIVLFISIHAVAAVCWLFLNPNRSIGEPA